MKHIAIFASGGGSNAKAIVQHLKNNPEQDVNLIVTNKKQAGVLDMARSEDIPSVVIDKGMLKDQERMMSLMKDYQVDFIVLAGFLALIPAYLVKAYPDKIVNIHPSLLPKYGGRGMYGSHVHQAVKEAGEAFSGMTIHYVNEAYDEGSIILQARVALDSKDTPGDIAAKVLQLEHRYYPLVVEELVGLLP